jgi:hypothetical protein
MGVGRTTTTRFIFFVEKSVSRADEEIVIRTSLVSGLFVRYGFFVVEDKGVGVSMLGNGPWANKVWFGSHNSINGPR